MELEGIRGGDGRHSQQGAAGLKGRAMAGPHNYEQIPALVERSVLRVDNFFCRSQ